MWVKLDFERPTPSVGDVGYDETAATLSVVGATLEDMLAEQRGLERDQQTASESKLSPKVLVMLPVFRFLQLLCENHNRDLQVRPPFVSNPRAA